MWWKYLPRCSVSRSKNGRRRWNTETPVTNQLIVSFKSIWALDRTVKVISSTNAMRWHGQTPAIKTYLLSKVCVDADCLISTNFENLYWLRWQNSSNFKRLWRCQKTRVLSIFKVSWKGCTQYFFTCRCQHRREPPLEARIWTSAFSTMTLFWTPSMLYVKQRFVKSTSKNDENSKVSRQFQVVNSIHTHRWTYFYDIMRIVA